MRGVLTTAASSMLLRYVPSFEVRAALQSSCQNAHATGAVHRDCSP